MPVLASAMRAALLAALAALTGCNDSSSGAGAAQPAPAAAPTAAAPSPSPTPPAPPPPAATPPAASAPGDPARGAVAYATYCASCHGDKGCGDGPLSASLTPRPAKHCDGAYMNPLKDDYLFRVIQQGGAAVGKSPLMAPWGGTLDDAKIRDVIAFVRTLAVPPYRPGS